MVEQLLRNAGVMAIEKLCVDIERVNEDIGAVKTMFEIVSEDLKEAMKNVPATVAEPMKALPFLNKAENEPKDPRRRKKRKEN